MSLLDGLLGNATNVDQDAIKKELKDVLIPNEEVDLAFRLVRDLVVFTSH